MKLLFFSIHAAHVKNLSGIQRMCASRQVDFELTAERARLDHLDYNLLICNDSIVPPQQIPWVNQSGEPIKIIYGPQYGCFPTGDVVGPQDPHQIRRCVYNVLAPWCEQVWTNYLGPERTIIAPYVYQPYGVDMDTFAPVPLGTPKLLDCVLYIKCVSALLVAQVVSTLNQKWIRFQAIVYGQYTEEQYWTALAQAKFMVVLDRHESQGFALQEAMSMDVPLLVLDSPNMYAETMDGYKSTLAHLAPLELPSTSVPYWSDQCGIKINSIEEFGAALDRMMVEYATFTPRDFVSDTLSDEVCMDRLLTYYHEP